MHSHHAPIAGAVFAALAASTALAGNWKLVSPVLVDPLGTYPAVWEDHVAYLQGIGGAVRYFDGTTSVELYPPDLYNYEPAMAADIIAWRNCQTAPTSNEIFRWDGTPVDISNSPGVLDSDVAVAPNGDVLWSKDHHWLLRYEAASGNVQDLGVTGVGVAAYLTDAGVLTYVYQDPDTHDVMYFDGSTTVFVGEGFGQENNNNAHASLWDGTVAYIGMGVGDTITKGELFVWQAGNTTRVTNDDAVNGIPDDYPSVWNDIVIWQRAPSASQSRIYLWDGESTTQLTTTRTNFPSYQGGSLAYVDYATGLYLARVIPIIAGDCNQDGEVDETDFANVATCMSGPDQSVSGSCTCGDLDGDLDVDVRDIALLQQAVGAAQ
jgi:hypothetical protein